MNNSPMQRKEYARPQLAVFGTVHNLTGGSLDVGTDTGFTAGKNNKSDMRYKENIARVGEHPAGFGLYLFDYKAEFAEKCGTGRRFGVMAQEVAPIVPEAVAYDEDGYASVNYGMLGIVLN